MTERRELLVPQNSIVPPDFSLDKNWEHVKARTESAEGYPERLAIPPRTTWENVGSSYRPHEYTAGKVLEKDKTKNPDDHSLWADSADITKVDHEYFSYEGEVRFDDNRRPLNPKGPTGLSGRGLLGKWGANFAADPIVTRINADGQFEIITIKRKDSGEFAIPGGMVDHGERITETLKRELGEETSAELDFETATPIYQGYVDDPRNTDNAWMETDVFHLHLKDGDATVLAAGDDAADASWHTVDSQLLENLYASHAQFVLGAVQNWQNETGFIVAQDGFVNKIT